MFVKNKAKVASGVGCSCVSSAAALKKEMR